VVQFTPRSWWAGKNYGKVDGTLYGADGSAAANLNGTWLERLSVAPAAPAGAPGRVLWTKHAPLPQGGQYYFFSRFCMELNELLPGMRDVIAPSDSRLRPDQRAMENGQLVRGPTQAHTRKHEYIKTYTHTHTHTHVNIRLHPRTHTHGRTHAYART
jgi:oxysterol-binding protein-related protein 3/6/7